jgi:hypothetical protein
MLNSSAQQSLPAFKKDFYCFPPPPPSCPLSWLLLVTPVTPLAVAPYLAVAEECAAGCCIGRQTTCFPFNDQLGRPWLRTKTRKALSIYV